MGWKGYRLGVKFKVLGSSGLLSHGEESIQLAFPYDNCFTKIPIQYYAAISPVSNFPDRARTAPDHEGSFTHQKPPFILV
jgi:hypothetical protein